MKRYLHIFAALFCGLVAMAQSGDTAYNFLDVSTSSRIYGLGGVNISLVNDDLLLTDQNPSLLGQEMSNSLAFSYMHYVGGSNFAAVKYAHATGERGTWAAGVQYFGYGSIKSADVAGNITGSFSPQDIAFTGAYSYELNERWRGGFNIKMLYSAYDAYSAFAVATDLGVNYFDDERDSSLSLTVSNLGGQLKKFADRADRLPIDIRLGWSKGLGSVPLTLNITAWNLTKWKQPYLEVGDGTSDPVIKDGFMSNLFRHLVFGLEWRPEASQFYVDLGYNYKTRTDMSTYSRSFISGFSLGAGMQLNKFSFGIALSQPHTGATTFMFNIATNLYEF